MCAHAQYIVTMWRVLKITFLYIGTVIGAGFASGREISVFFGDTAPLGVALSAVFMAALAALFMTAGRLGALPDGTAVRTGVVIASFSSVAAMLAGGEFALRSVFGVPSLGVLMAVAAGVAVTLGIEKIKVLNTVLIPLLIALLVSVYVKVGAPVFQGSFSVVKPVHYAGLDVLLGGIVIAREGEKLNGKQIAGLVSYIRRAFALYAERHAVSPREKPSPLARFAAFYSLPDNRRLAVFLPLPVLYAVSLFGFDLIVDSLYPFVGLCGMAMTAGTAFNLARRTARAARARGKEKALPAERRAKSAFAAPSRAEGVVSRGDVRRNRSRSRPHRRSRSRPRRRPRHRPRIRD